MPAVLALLFLAGCSGSAAGGRRESGSALHFDHGCGPSGRIGAARPSGVKRRVVVVAEGSHFPDAARTCTVSGAGLTLLVPRGNGLVPGVG